MGELFAHRSSCLRRAASALALAAAMLCAGAHAGPAEDFADGKALGHARKGEVTGRIKDGSAASADPNYNASAPHKAYYGNINLSGPAATTQSLCAADPSDPVCAAVNTSQTPRPRQYLKPSDPALAGQSVTEDPSKILGNITATYSACATDTQLLAPAQYARASCRIDTAPWTTHVCEKTLSAFPKDQYSCVPGTWYARGQADHNRADHMLVEALCEPERRDGKMRFRAWAHGANGACGDWQAFELDMSKPAPSPGALPIKVAGLAPHWENSCRAMQVFAEGKGCTDSQCQKTFHFFWTGEAPFVPQYTCGSGVPGPDIGIETCIDGACTTTRGSPGQCYTRFASPADAPGKPGMYAHHLAAGPMAAYGWWAQSAPATISGYAPKPGIAHWAIPMVFDKPVFEHLAGDYWDNACLAFEKKSVAAALPPDGQNPPPVDLPVLANIAAEQCTRTKSVCLDGAPAKTIDAVEVKRECWKYQNTFECTTLAPSTNCNDPRFRACTQAGAPACLAFDAAGHCLSARAEFECKVKDALYGPAVNCGASSFCAGGSCYDTAHPADADFAKTVAYLEAGREAGVYLDTADLTVFKGFDNRCSIKLFGLKSCCKSSGGGGAFSNAALFGAALNAGKEVVDVGSGYVYDMLYNAEAPQWLTQSFGALLGTAGFDSVFNPTFSFYGVSASFGGAAALPASSTLVYQSGSFVVAFDPWSLAVAVVVYVVFEMTKCDQDEQILSMKKGQNLCHPIGEYCASKFLGACLKKTQSYCCFNSRLSRLINEQGRAQLGRGWGEAKNPDCRGMTVAQLQSLDFSKMDLSEFYAEIAPTIPDLARLQNKADTAIKSYFAK